MADGEPNGTTLMFSARKQLHPNAIRHGGEVQRVGSKLDLALALNTQSLRCDFEYFVFRI